MTEMLGPDVLSDSQIVDSFADALGAQRSLPIIGGVLDEIDNIIYEDPTPSQDDIVVIHADELGEHVAYGKFRKITTLVTNIEDSVYTRQIVELSGVIRMDSFGAVSIRSTSRRVYKPEKVNLYSQEDFLTEEPPEPPPPPEFPV